MTNAFVIEPGEHAELSASSAERWTTCTGSPALIKGLPNHGSKYAAEGTAAHWIAAWAQQDYGRFAHHWRGLTAKVEGYDIELTAELCEAVQEFLDYIKEHEQPGDVAFIEHSFTEAMRKLHPKFGGSADRVMWRAKERLLRVYDYKHGAGVSVDVDDNKQLKYYALGCLLSFPQFNAETVELVIAQPRCDHEQGRIRKYTMSAMELLDYAADLIDAAEETEDFTRSKLVPSVKACKFCPAKAARKCPAIEKEMHAITAQDFSVVDPALYSKEQIAEFLAKAPLVESAISAVREFAYQEALKGNDFPGFKIVEKRATRKWKDKQAAAQALAEAPPAVWTEPELKSPAQVEKVLGKKKFALVEAQHVVKESSGFTLVPTTDPRPPATVGLLEDFSAAE